MNAPGLSRNALRVWAGGAMSERCRPCRLNGRGVPVPVLHTPWFWWCVMAVIRNLPRPIFERMKI